MPSDSPLQHACVEHEHAETGKGRGYPPKHTPKAIRKADGGGGVGSAGGAGRHR